ncbi:MAG: ABC transporter ATP-binding protein [Pseudonocardiaceae bacterium]
MIRLVGAGLTYPGPPPVPALKPVDLVVQRGEYLTVIGPSGSGKSTFLNVVGLLDRPTEGVVELDGVDVGQLDEAHRATIRGHRIGIVFQEYHLLSYRTAMENVAMAQLYAAVPKKRRLAAARNALDWVGLTYRRHALPTTLSGGERQRVTVARALVHHPTLLLCDEPTGNLDSASAWEVLALLDELHANGFTLVVVTHDAGVAARGQRMITIHDGMLYA